MEVTDPGILTDVKLEQLAKAQPPMEVTVGGMVTALSILQFLKASLGISVTP